MDGMDINISRYMRPVENVSVALEVDRRKIPPVLISVKRGKPTLSERLMTPPYSSSKSTIASGAESTKGCS
jgi:hypothetical protein